jgi:hypothetical protein
MVACWHRGFDPGSTQTKDYTIGIGRFIEKKEQKLVSTHSGECVSEGPKGETCLPVDWCFRVITIKIQLSITSQAILQL